MEEATVDKLKQIVKQKGWERKITHKRFFGISSLIALARQIKRSDVAVNFRLVLNNILNASTKLKKQKGFDAFLRRGSVLGEVTAISLKTPCRICVLTNRRL